MERKYIVVEGVDFIGKDTCVERFKNEFGDKYNVLFVSEPGKYGVRGKIREFLLDKNTKINKITESLLFALDRSLLSEQLNEYNDIDIIISNRSYISSLVYQLDDSDYENAKNEYVKNVYKYHPLVCLMNGDEENDKYIKDEISANIEKSLSQNKHLNESYMFKNILNISEFAYNTNKPNYLILFHISDFEKFKNRVNASNRELDRIESIGVEEMFKLNNRYLDVIQNCGIDEENIYVIDSFYDKDEVYNKFKDVMLEIINK